MRLIITLDGTGCYYDCHEPTHIDALLGYALMADHGMTTDLSYTDTPKEFDLPLESVMVNGEKIWKASVLLPKSQHNYLETE